MLYSCVFPCDCSQTPKIVYFFELFELLKTAIILYEKVNNYILLRKYFGLTYIFFSLDETF